jgi:hypothetical protein
VEEGDCVGAVCRRVDELVGELGVEGGEAAEHVDEAGAQAECLVLVGAGGSGGRGELVDEGAVSGVERVEVPRA